MAPNAIQSDTSLILCHICLASVSSSLSCSESSQKSSLTTINRLRRHSRRRICFNSSSQHHPQRITPPPIISPPSPTPPSDPPGALCRKTQPFNHLLSDAISSSHSVHRLWISSNCSKGGINKHFRDKRATSLPKLHSPAPQSLDPAVWLSNWLAAAIRSCL